MEPADHSDLEKESTQGSNRARNPAPAPAENEVLFGRYRISRELGRGGMGLVLLARDLELNIDIAIKIIPDLLLQDLDALDELKGEVLRGVALSHPGVVRTHGFVRDETSAAIVMEYVDGGHFTDLKRSHPGGCFDADDLLPWLEQLGPALDYAHFEIGIAHRDLKPRNLMFTRSGRIKVADFGVSSSLNDSVTRVSLHGSSSGTPAYMSPQQIMGERPSHLDDIYALGATIFELLTGKPPFHRGQVLAQVLDSLPVTMSARREELGVIGKATIPPSWEETVAACLAKDPAGRPQSAGEVIERLKSPSAIRPPVEPVEIPSEVARNAVSPARRAGSNPRRVAAWWLLGMLLAAAGGFAVVKNRPDRDSTAIESLPPPPDAAPLEISTPARLSTGTAGIAYRQDLVAAGGTLPYAWSLESGALPDGLGMNASGGIIEGIPTAAVEAAIFVARVADNAGGSATRQFEIKIEPAAAAIPLPVFGPDPPPGPQPEPEEKPASPPLPAPEVAPKLTGPLVNTLDMSFVDSGTPEVLMSVWLTRVRDFRAFVQATQHDAKRQVYSIRMGGAPEFGLHGHHWEAPGFSQGDDSPVCGVSWNDAKAFCQWLTEKDGTAGKLPPGFAYRLPTGAEWKRALALEPPPGKAFLYPWGDQWPPPLDLRCNLAGNELIDAEMPQGWPMIAEFRDEWPRTSPVDEFPANRLGIKDLYSNLSQFCEDPAPPGSKSRLMRGGSWCTPPSKDFLIDGTKNRLPDFRVVDAGFRCVIARN